MNRTHFAVSGIINAQILIAEHHARGHGVHDEIENYKETRTHFRPSICFM